MFFKVLDFDKPIYDDDASKIYESSNFVGQAQPLLRRLGIREVGYDHVDWNFTYLQATFAYVISSLGSSKFKDNVWRDDAWKLRQDNHLSSEYSSLASGLLSMGSQIGTRSQTCTLKPHVSSMPIASSSSSSFNGFHNLFHETPSINNTSHKFTNQQEALTEAQILLPPNKGGFFSNFKCPSNLLTTYFKSNTRAKETRLFSYMEHKPFPGLTMLGVFNMIPTTFDSSTTRSDAFDVCQNSTLMHDIVDQFDVKSNSTLEEHRLQVLLRLQLMLKSLLDVKNDTGWKYPDRFSQPNPPPYGGKPDIFL